MNANWPHIRMKTSCDRARWILCSHTPSWARAVRSAIRFDWGLRGVKRRFLEARLLEVSSHEACFAELQIGPASFVTVGDDAERLADCLELTANVGRRFPCARIAIASSCGDGDPEWHSRSLAFREAGAVMVTRHIWDLAALARSAHRHLANVRVVEQSITDRIWDSLPWDSL